MKSKALPHDESSFFQRIKEDTLGTIFWERLELKTDSGFPDTYFVLRNPRTMYSEGTVELKFWKDKGTPNPQKMLRGTQKANFLEYFEAGGRRRWLLACNSKGTVFLYTARVVCEILLGQRTEAFSRADLDDDVLPVRIWLPTMLEM